MIKTVFMAVKESAKVYDLALNGPGMLDEFKLSFPASRKTIVLLCLLIENAVSPAKERTEELSLLLDKETGEKLSLLTVDLLKKGGPGMVEFYNRLKAM